MQTQEGCRTTILTALKIEKMSQKIPREKPLITEEHRQARLKFCRKWRDLTPDDWLAMFAFTDESAMQVGKSGRSYIWRTRGEDAFSPDVLKPKFSKLSQCNVHGIISGKGILHQSHFFKEYIDTNTDKIIGKEPLLIWQRRWGKNLNAKNYMERILPVLDNFFQQNPEKMLVEDNAKPYTADDCEAAKNSRPWIRITWPPNSPDLNPIENIWRRIKQKIYGSGNPRPRKIAELRAAVQKAWDKLTDEEVRSEIASMPFRIHECLKRNGGITKW